MAAADVRSALIVSCGNGPDQRTAHLEPSAEQAMELARLLGDPAVGGFDVSMMVAPTGAALRRELTRFLADRAPQDTVVVHLAGRVVVAADGEHHVCGTGSDLGATGVDVDGLAVASLEEELRRCRSERIILLLDCPADEPATSRHQGGAEPGVALHERLRAPGRWVEQTSTAAVIELLRQGRADDDLDPAAPLRALLLQPVTVPLAATHGLLAAVASVVSAALFVISIVLIGSGGAAGLAVATTAVVVIVAPVVRRATLERWGLPPDDTVLGDGVPFHCLYMLRRSQKSKDYFRHH